MKSKYNSKSTCEHVVSRDGIGNIQEYYKHAFIPSKYPYR